MGNETHSTRSAPLEAMEDFYDLCRLGLRAGGVVIVTIIALAALALVLTG